MPAAAVNFTPAPFRRAFCCLLLAALGGETRAAPPSTTPPPLAQVGAADPAEGRRVLAQLRRQGIAGEYFLEFELRVRPRRGDERVVTGRMWGGRNRGEAITRVELGAGAALQRLLLQNGAEPAAWHWTAAQGVARLGGAALFEPVVPECELSAFELLMPFIHWPDYAYEGLARVRGRPAHVFRMLPPPALAAARPGLTGVRVSLDTQYNALVQTELLGPGGAVVKSLAIVDLKKIGDQWIVKSVDLRDETTRNKTRFAVVAAGLSREFSGALFTPATLADEVKPPPAATLTRVER